MNERDKMIERLAAARTLADTRPSDEKKAMEMAAFMEVFHPDDERTTELVREVREALGKGKK